MRVLCIVAHPDDETIGCGGTLAKWASEGHEVGAIAFTNGVGARCPTAPWSSETSVETRKQEWIAALKTIHVRDPLGLAASQWGWPDQGLDGIPVCRLSQYIEQDVIPAFNPDTVITHWPGDLNADHRRVAEAVLVATRPAAGSTVSRVLACEIPESTSQAFGAFPPFAPNVYVGLGIHMKAKQAAMACYESEKREPNHPRSIATLTHHATVRGSECGQRRAEAFVLLREIQ